MKKYYLNDISKELKINETTLRYYDEKGLFPKMNRDINNYRYVLEEDLSLVNIVICLKRTGMPLKEIQKYVFLVIEGDTSIEERYKMILKQEIIVAQKFKDIQEQIDFIEYKKDYYQKAIKKNNIN